MIKYSTIKELRFLREDTYVIYYVGSSVGSFFVVVFLRVTLCSVLVLRSLCFFLFFLPSVICTFFLSRVVLILLKYFVMLWLDRAVMASVVGWEWMIIIIIIIIITYECMYIHWKGTLRIKHIKFMSEKELKK